MRRTALLGTLALVLSAGCAGDPSGPHVTTMADLAGSWTLTRAEIVSVAQPAHKVDLMDLGITGALTITPGGSFRLIVSFQGETPDTLTGALALRGDTLDYLPGGGEPLHYTLSLRSDVMSWTSVETDDFFDVDGDGSSDETREQVEFRRQRP